VRQAGASGPPTLRADSRFFSWKTIKTLKAKNVTFSITVSKNQTVTGLIAGITDNEWIPIGYTQYGEAQIAETNHNKERLIVRSTRLTGRQGDLFPNWRYHAFITNRTGTTVFLDADHRRHAVVEPAIRDRKEGSAGNHCTSGIFTANAAWVVLAALAHNLIRWVASLRLGTTGPVAAKTMRRRLISVPGRITRWSRRTILHLPTNWPWKRDSPSPPTDSEPTRSCADQRHVLTELNRHLTASPVAELCHRTRRTPRK
jgi:hypothetical protein